MALEFRLEGPEGPIELPKEVYKAVRDFLTEKFSGSVTIHFRSGETAGVEIVRKQQILKS